MTRALQVRKETGTQPMTRSASDLPRRTPPSNKTARTASGPPASETPRRLGLLASRRVTAVARIPLVLTVGHSTRTLKEVRRSTSCSRRQAASRCSDDPALATQSAIQFKAGYLARSRRRGFTIGTWLSLAACGMRVLTRSTLLGEMPVSAASLTTCRLPEFGESLEPPYSISPKSDEPP